MVPGLGCANKKPKRCYGQHTRPCSEKAELVPVGDMMGLCPLASSASPFIIDELEDCCTTTLVRTHYANTAIQHHQTQKTHLSGDVLTDRQVGWTFLPVKDELMVPMSTEFMNAACRANANLVPVRD